MQTRANDFYFARHPWQLTGYLAMIAFSILVGGGIYDDYNTYVLLVLALTALISALVAEVLDSDPASASKIQTFLLQATRLFIFCAAVSAILAALRAVLQVS